LICDKLGGAKKIEIRVAQSVRLRAPKVCALKLRKFVLRHFFKGAEQ